MSPLQTLWLGSQSPRRAHLLTFLGLTWHTAVAEVDEDIIQIPDPPQNVLARARLKGDSLRPQLGDNDLLLTADTTVALGEDMLNKPDTPDAARAMLRRLRGQWHQVHTGMVLYHGRGGDVLTDISTTNVLMRDYSDDEIEAYVATGDPLDKAGSYAIQHPHFRPVARLEGCYLGVMGLSVCRLIPLLKKQGFNLSTADTDAIQTAHQHYPCHTWST